MKFDSNWTDEEIATVTATVNQNMSPGAVSNWRFMKFNGYYTAWRSTWEMGSLHGSSAEELAAEIQGYYDMIYTTSRV